MKRMDVAENSRALNFNFSHQSGQKSLWVINLEVGPATIKAHASQTMGRVNKKAKAVWKLILRPTVMSAMEGNSSLQIGRAHV